jgi:pentatricopeptide repeat protein
MQYKAIPWNCFTIVCSLKACSIMGAGLKGSEIHMEVVCGGYEMDLLIANMLIDMYAKCGLLAMAEEVFEKVPVRNVVSWTTLMTGFSENGYFEKGFNFLEQMQDEKVPLNIVTYLCSLKICVGIGSKSKGQEMHSEISKKGLEGKAFVGSSLVDMYAKCNSLMEAQFVFDGLPSQTVVAWNALIGGYVEHGHCFTALDHLRAMQEEGVSGDALTLACSLKACGKSGGATGVHMEIVKKGFERDSLVENVLVDMYARCGSLEEARQVFDEALVRDIVSWNALVAGHVEHGCAEDVRGYVKEMQQIGVLFNVVTFICCLKACATIGDASAGYELHCACTKRGLEGELPVGNALIDMYANFGLLPESWDVFDGLGAARDAISWNALAAGFAQIGESENVLRVLIKMLEEGFEPDAVTFTSVLNACSHAGLMEEGQAAFELIGDRGLRPSRDHYTCVVDLLGRAGCIESAMKMIEEMPFCPSLLQWHTVLAACRKWGDADCGRHAFEHALCLDESNPSAYVYMSNICADLPAPVEANMHGV